MSDGNVVNPAAEVNRSRDSTANSGSVRTVTELPAPNLPAERLLVQNFFEDLRQVMPE